MQDRDIDLGDEAVLTSRTWPWLRTRILGLLSTDSRLARQISPRFASSLAAS